MTAGVPACQDSATESCDRNSVGQLTDTALQASGGYTDGAGQLHNLKLSDPAIRMPEHLYRDIYTGGKHLATGR